MHKKSEIIFTLSASTKLERSLLYISTEKNTQFQYQLNRLAKKIKTKFE